MGRHLDAPLITTVISTRNSGDRVTLPLRGILGNDYPNFEVIVVDQSENDLTQSAMKPFLADPRVHYVHSPTQGLSVGRNLGISQGRGQWITMTDDDCEVPTNWLREFASAFSVDRNIAVIFGNVLPAEHDSTSGFVAFWRCNTPMLARSLGEKHFILGMGACMGVRRSTWQGLGGFDELLGAGAPLKAGEETDFAIRALQAGHYIFETPRVTVTHHAFYLWNHARAVIYGYDYGIGAAVAKHFKRGRWLVGWYYLRLGCQWLLGWRFAVQGGIPGHKILKLAAFAQGFIGGLLTPVDQKKGCFRDRRKKATGHPGATP